MLWPYTLALVVALVLSAKGKGKGPMWAFAIAWLVTTAPITLDLIVYSDLKDIDRQTTIVLLAAMAALSAGVALGALLHGISMARSRKRPEVVSTGSSLDAMYPYIKV